jgi:transcriptional regulator with XRE-family HTH domain
MAKNERLRQTRFFAKKPQIQLWLETGIHYSTISRIECGYIEPTEEQRKKLSEALGVKTDWLFPEEKSN